LKLFPLQPPSLDFAQHHGKRNDTTSARARHIKTIISFEVVQSSAVSIPAPTTTTQCLLL
jgi:hypothetical protein